MTNTYRSKNHDKHDPRYVKHFLCHFLTLCNFPLPSRHVAYRSKIAKHGNGAGNWGTALENEDEVIQQVIEEVHSEASHVRQEAEQTATATDSGDDSEISEIVCLTIKYEF